MLKAAGHPSEIAPAACDGSAACTGRNPPLPCPGPPWLSGLVKVRLTIGLRNSNARSMHTGDLSPAVPEAGQSSGGDQTLIWESSSPAYPSWSSLAISQASPSVHPSTASASTASIHHPRMVRSPVLVRPSPKTLSKINNEQSTAISKPAACIIASVYRLTRTPCSAFFACSFPA